MNVEIEDLEAVTDIINSTFRQMAINYEEKNNYVIFRYFMISKKNFKLFSIVCFSYRI